MKLYKPSWTVALLTCASLATACGDDGGGDGSDPKTATTTGTTTGTEPGNVMLRVFHGSPFVQDSIDEDDGDGEGNVDIYIAEAGGEIPGSPTIEDVGFGDSSAYQSVSAVSYDIYVTATGVTPEDNATPDFANVALSEGEDGAITVVVYDEGDLGEDTTPSIQVIIEDLSDPSPLARVDVVHAAEGVGEVDILAPGKDEQISIGVLEPPPAAPLALPFEEDGLPIRRRKLDLAVGNDQFSCGTLPDIEVGFNANLIATRNPRRSPARIRLFVQPIEEGMEAAAIDSISCQLLQ